MSHQKSSMNLRSSKRSSRNLRAIIIMSTNTWRTRRFICSPSPWSSLSAIAASIIAARDTDRHYHPYRTIDHERDMLHKLKLDISAQNRHPPADLDLTGPGRSDIEKSPKNVNSKYHILFACKRTEL